MQPQNILYITIHSSFFLIAKNWKPCKGLSAVDQINNIHVQWKTRLSERNHSYQTLEKENIVTKVHQWCPGPRNRRKVLTTNRHFPGQQRCPRSQLWQWEYDSVVSKLITLYTFNCWISLYLNYLNKALRKRGWGGQRDKYDHLFKRAFATKGSKERGWQLVLKVGLRFLVKRDQESKFSC